MNEKNKACSSSVPAIITYILTLGGLVVIYCLFRYPIPEDNKAIIYTLLGSCTTVYLSCMAFWFGSNYGALDKAKMLYNSKPIEEIKDESEST